MTNSDRSDLKKALIATLFFGAAGGIFTATLNNYLSEIHNLGAEARGWLEFPRELPGFMMIFVTGVMLIVIREAQLAAFAMLFTAIGAIGLGFLSPSHTLLILWIMIWSLGDHIIFSMEAVIGLKLATDGAEGKRLGQFGGARNFGTIIGVGAVFVLANIIGDAYYAFYLVAAVCGAIAGVFYLLLTVGSSDPPPRRLVLKKKYSLFYIISALFGIRKQIFLAFGGWVLVSIYGVQVSTVALLYFIAATLGVVLRPLLGEVIDWLGERFVLSADELMLVIVCLCYAFASDILASPYDLYLLYGAYIVDIILFALRVARTTYLKKIADDPADIAPTISMGITIDHMVAMSLPILSGYVWEEWGYRWVFIIAGSIAFAGYFVCLRIKVPETKLDIKHSDI